MGRLIPAGTGLGAYKRLSIHTDSSEAGESPIAGGAPQPDLAVANEAGE